MRGIYVGIDVGGTHTDGVAVEGNIVLHKVKVRTREDLQACSVEALEELLGDLPPHEIRRVVLSTTLVTNAVIQGRLEPTGTILTAGPGVDPALLAVDEYCRVVPGAMDHRGREIVPLNEQVVAQCLEEFIRAGVRTLAVAGKFSVRNPTHENRIAELAADRFDCVMLGHALSGSLNFPRRAATAYLSAGICPRHTAFVRSMLAAVEKFGISAPLYLLRADGGTQLADSFRNPAETALSGPAASVMGVEALDSVREETLALDVGGTTTDISLFSGQAPLMEPRGATIGRYRTQIRSLYTRSTGAGGDSLVKVQNGDLSVGPERIGPPAALGGTHPTPTDALVLLGRATGDRKQAAVAFTPVAHALAVSVETAARRVLDCLARKIADAAREFVEEVNAKSVYTIHELLEGHRVQPRRAVAVGGPARAIAPYVEAALDLPVHVPDHFDVANAVGASLARVNLEVNLSADTGEGTLSIPEAGVFREISKAYSIEQAKAEAIRSLLELAKAKGLLESGVPTDIAEEETFKVVEDFVTVGAIHRIRAQIRPGIVGRIE